MSQDQTTNNKNTSPSSAQGNDILGDLFTTQNDASGEQTQNKTPPGVQTNEKSGQPKDINPQTNSHALVPQTITTPQEGSIVTIQKSPGQTTSQTIPIIINTSPNAHTQGSPQNTINLPISIGNNLPQATIVIQIF